MTRGEKERHNNEMTRDTTQWECVAGENGVVFVQCLTKRMQLSG